ncbi:MBL fold metallo-hydrolase [Aporhodopirellula aestuarii]|uniref:MBL fold metallo-hydrolase n=1 Tax=Aporhodopirellula aestuarii TaxID=2950107 RepID=A0ABT0U7I6_9BACT|nr:MBL fold metallo-hydrolase [Aporhodopirellula aestuarii]MCM2372877.1 MBL fold metallo-hydrolase [Aporhodopirellula aestuarii]
MTLHENRTGTATTPDQTNDPTQPFQPEVIFLGTGTSVGVPSLGCHCDVCTSDDPRNNRTRCAIVVRLPAGNLLIDTPPDLRSQLLREKISLVHAVLFTHEHVDHLYGLDDLRLFPFQLGHAIPLYCEPDVEDRIRRVYDYAFTNRTQTHPGSRPQLCFERITHDPFEVLGVEATPIPMRHGPHFDVLGFRIGNFAYCTDTNYIPPDSIERLRGVDTLVIDALRYKSHPTHFSVDEALEVIREVKPRSAFLTHICHDLDHGVVEQQLPDGVHLAYDGLRLPLSQ